MSNIQTLIFDFGGVIINLKTEEDWVKEDLLPNFEPDKLHQLHQQGYFRDFETGKITPSDFMQQMKSIALDPTISIDKIKQHWNGILKDIPQYRVDLLHHLKEKYRLILLSNTNAIHVESFQYYMQQEFGEDILQANFHTVYYSQEIGLRKPEREIYEFVLHEQQLPPESCIFLDDKSENLVEAQNVGIQTILVDFNNLSKSALADFLQ